MCSYSEGTCAKRLPHRPNTPDRNPRPPSSTYTVLNLKKSRVNHVRRLLPKKKSRNSLFCPVPRDGPPVVSSSRKGTCSTHITASSLFTAHIHKTDTSAQQKRNQAKRKSKRRTKGEAARGVGKWGNSAKPPGFFTRNTWELSKEWWPHNLTHTWKCAESNTSEYRGRYKFNPNLSFSETTLSYFVPVCSPT